MQPIQLIVLKQSALSMLAIIQAGREIRIMVKPEQVGDDDMLFLSKEIAKKIESELEYPGQIKIHLIRETRAYEYAK